MQVKALGAAQHARGAWQLWQGDCPATTVAHCWTPIHSIFSNSMGSHRVTHVLSKSHSVCSKKITYVLSKSHSVCPPKAIRVLSPFSNKS